MPTTGQSPAKAALTQAQEAHREVTQLDGVTRSPYLHYNVALSITFLTGFLAATYATIPDCDEVFNYWEPTHYLLHGNGLQTWEYSPAYAIRSWLYIGIHALITLPLSAAGFDKKYEFMLLRSFLIGVASLSQTELYDGLSRVLGPDIGLIFLLISVSSAGMFQAAPAYLPSSFAMYFVMFGTAAFLKASRHPVKALIFFSIAGLWGWPFSLALMIPQLTLWAVDHGNQHGIFSAFNTLVRNIWGPIVVLAFIVVIDSVAYRKLAFVPLNIVLYNVFGGEGKGPDLYGTEPWWYYIANLALNFNFMAAAAFSSIFFQVIGSVAWPSRADKNQMVLLLPFYLWFFIFTMQPHKEERFMYPAYPALCINAALSLFWLKHAISRGIKRIKSGIPDDLISTIVVSGILFIFTLVSASRIIAVTTGYGAPIAIYTTDRKLALTGNVCFGKEWYRFPSSFFLPGTARPRFIKSSFAGLLPGAFPEETDGFRDGTWRIPENMNDVNREDYSKYIPVGSCDYIVDSYFSKREEQNMEPNYILDAGNWDQVTCGKFLDASKTPFLGRVLWLPSWLLKDTREWGDYCILRRK
ncbi:mannosyltransferase [Orbilia ellipsospora]|uniref:Mannosyltransferase n=1 Tax=Orbilia ellipsospora TaxID=2528407 RepID=A0AAV9WWE3_9PEZI